MSDDIPDLLSSLFPNYKTYEDAWAHASGYVAAMVGEGSEDAVKILTYMHELKPSTAMFTGTVDGLRGNQGKGDEQCT